MDTQWKVVFVLLALFGLAACNTTKGLGQDVEAAGDAIEDTAQDAQDELSDDD
jgi:predicted small secreted protein